MTDFEPETGLTSDWLHEFVVESNRIDPQVGNNAPGDPLYDLHHAALQHCIASALADRYALPRELHSMLLPEHPLGGVVRAQESHIGFRKMLQPHRVPYYTWRWNADARESIGELRWRRSRSEERQNVLWDLHCELMNIRPFEMYNGRVGRLLLVNHAILLGEQPPLIRFSERDDYIDMVRGHLSATWVDEPLYKPSAIRYHEWKMRAKSDGPNPVDPDEDVF